jgi:hypothetical protein
MTRRENPTLDHAAAQRLLPWLLTDTLDGAELARVRAHLHGCGACRDDLARERRLRAAGQHQAELDPALDPDAALGRLAPRLDRPPARFDLLRRWARALASKDGRWWRPLALAQSGAIAALVALLLARPDAGDARYRLLAAGAPVQGDLVVAFRPDTPERELRRILQDSGARVLDGPTAAGAYVLAARADTPARALARLRAEPAVTLAQPLAAEGRP